MSDEADERLMNAEENNNIDDHPDDVEADAIILSDFVASLVRWGTFLDDLSEQNLDEIRDHLEATRISADGAHRGRLLDVNIDRTGSVLNEVTDRAQRTEGESSLSGTRRQRLFELLHMSTNTGEEDQPGSRGDHLINFARVSLADSQFEAEAEAESGSEFEFDFEFEHRGLGRLALEPHGDSEWEAIDVDVDSVFVPRWVYTLHNLSRISSRLLRAATMTANEIAPLLQGILIPQAAPFQDLIDTLLVERSIDEWSPTNRRLLLTSAEIYEGVLMTESWSTLATALSQFDGTPRGTASSAANLWFAASYHIHRGLPERLRERLEEMRERDAEGPSRGVEMVSILVESLAERLLGQLRLMSVEERNRVL
jgi:hypothetical protein